MSRRPDARRLQDLSSRERRQRRGWMWEMGDAVMQWGCTYGTCRELGMRQDMLTPVTDPGVIPSTFEVPAALSSSANAL